MPDVYQNSDANYRSSSSPVYARYFDESTLKYGELITDQNQVILSLEFAETVVASSTAQTLGITDPKDLLTLKIEYRVSDVTVEVEIVGLADTGDVAFYAKEETIWMMATGMGLYEVYEDQITITDQDTTAHNHPVYTFEDVSTFYPVGTEIPNNLDDITTNLQAKFTKDNENVPDVLYTLETLRESTFNSQHDPLITIDIIKFHAVDPDQALVDLADVTEKVEYPYPVLRSNYLSNRLLQSVGKLLFAGIFLAASSIASYFILRSSLLSRIYEVSVYRALGAKKNDLRKVYFIEALILTAMTSLWGYIIVNILLLRLQNMTTEFLSVIRVTPLSFVVGLAIIFTVNILSGIIPISTLLNRTPAEIISKYDF
jgi:ABC-type antimicrobial peptide transport system permease subunit